MRDPVWFYSILGISLIITMAWSTWLYRDSPEPNKIKRLAETAAWTIFAVFPMTYFCVLISASLLVIVGRMLPELLLLILPMILMGCGLFASLWILSKIFDTEGDEIITFFVRMLVSCAIMAMLLGK